MKLTDYLGDKPFWRVTARLALPVALQNVLTSSFQLVDTMMVSRLGDVVLSAVGMAVGLAVRTARLRALLGHERIHLAVLGRQGSQGDPARHGAGAGVLAVRVAAVSGRRAGGPGMGRGTF